MSDITIILIALLVIAVLVIVLVVREHRKKVLASLTNISTRAQTLDIPLSNKNTGTNIYTSNWRATGKNVSVPQYSVDVTIQWTDKLNVQQTRSETLLFPNFLKNVGAEDLKEWLTNLMISEARQRLEID